MRNSTKGALAAATAAALLLGGAGSLAFWTDSVTIGGSTITAGHMSLDDTNGEAGCAGADWTLDGGAVFDAATGTLVPGDVLTKVCTFDVNASGDHLRATLGTTGGTATGALTEEVVTAASFVVDGATATEVTEADHGDVLTATITLTFDEVAATNASQDDALDLSAYTVSLTQVH